MYQVYQVYQEDKDQISGATYISDVVFVQQKLVYWPNWIEKLSNGIPEFKMTQFATSDSPIGFDESTELGEGRDWQTILFHSIY